jgi:hypothetical protein
VHAVERQHLEEALDRLVVELHAEVLADRLQRIAVLRVVCGGVNVERHQNSSGQYGGRGVRNSALAHSSAPGFSSSTRCPRARA